MSEMDNISYSPEQCATRKDSDTDVDNSLIADWKNAVRQPRRSAPECEILRARRQANERLQKADIINFVKNNITRKECSRFVAIPVEDFEPGTPEIGTSAVCHCGASIEQHKRFSNDDASNPESPVTPEVFKNARDWSAETDIIQLPTNAFGKIDFLGGDHPEKAMYVRLADDTDAKSVMQLMTESWCMREPDFIISFIGGPERCRMREEKERIFAEALDEINRRFHMWVLSHGCNAGVMKLLEKFVRLTQATSRQTNLHLLGVAPWGYIENSQSLTETIEMGCWNAGYDGSDNRQSLSQDNTNFLFVDDGFRGHFRSVTHFRSALENEMSTSFWSPTSGSTVSKAVVVVLVQGGTDSIVHVKTSLEQGIPVLVCEGTGRAADVLAYAYRHYVVKNSASGKREISRRHMSNLRCKALATYGSTWRGSMDDEHKRAEWILKLVMECCFYEDLLTIYSMDSPRIDLTVALYMLVYKVNFDAKVLTQIAEKLHQAAIMDNMVAAQAIFEQKINWKEGSLDEVMYVGLTQAKVGIVRLCLENGFDLQKYLTVERLWELYDGMVNVLHYRHAPRNLSEVGALISKLICNKYLERYYKDSTNNLHAVFEQPYRELFLWTILTDRRDIQELIWARSEDRIVLALAASHIYSSMARRLGEPYANRRKSFLQREREFEKLAMSLLEGLNGWQACCDLIEKRHVIWGGKNSLDMAAAAECKEFLSTVPCQLSLNSRWRRDIKCQPYWIFIIMFCPFLILCNHSFMHTRNIRSNFRAMFVFYSAPVTKFVANMCMYFVFLILYSYVILFDFHPTMTISEYVMVGWMLTMLLEEIREMLFASNAQKLSGRIYDWWYSAINRMDLVIFVLATIGFILRKYLDCFGEAKTVYCINCIFLYARLLRFFSASNHLGPKLIMIYEMMRELLFYLVIMIVFFLAHGVAVIAITHETRPFEFDVIRDIFYYPYWQMFGELSLDVLQGQTDDCINSTIRIDGRPCAQFSVLVPMLTAGYLMLTSVLLLNLLIAIFNHVFESVERETIENYRFGMYFLMLEYDKKPVLPPPFIIIEHILVLLKYLFCIGLQKIPLRDSVHRPLERLERLEMVGMTSRRDKLREQAAMRRLVSKTSAENHHALTQSRIEQLNTRQEQMSERQESISEREEEIAARHHDMLLTLQKQLDKLLVRHMRMSTSSTGALAQSVGARHSISDDTALSGQMREAVDRMKRIEYENERLLSKIDQIQAGNRNIEDLVNSLRHRLEQTQ